MKTYIVYRISTFAKAYYVKASTTQAAENKLVAYLDDDIGHRDVDKAVLRDIDDYSHIQCDGETV